MDLNLSFVEEAERRHNLKEMFVELDRLPVNSLNVTNFGSNRKMTRRSKRTCTPAVGKKPVVSSKVSAKLECGTCGQVLPCSQMNSHLRHHIYITSSKHGCFICPKFFKKLSDLYKHLELHSQESTNGPETEVLPIVSDVSVASDLTSCSESEEIPPDKVEGFGRCKQCNKFFHYRQSLHRHMKLHEENLNTDKKKSHPRKFFKKCPSCRKIYKRQDSFRLHINKCKARLTKITCKKCKLQFFYKWQLTRHELEKHEKQTCFQCFFCLKFFTKNRYLQKHFSIHFKACDFSEIIGMRNCFVKLEPLPDAPKLKSVNCMTNARFNLDTLKEAPKLKTTKKTARCNLDTLKEAAKLKTTKKTVRCNLDTLKEAAKLKTTKKTVRFNLDALQKTPKSKMTRKTVRFKLDALQKTPKSKMTKTVRFNLDNLQRTPKLKTTKKTFRFPSEILKSEKPEGKQLRKRRRKRCWYQKRKRNSQKFEPQQQQQPDNSSHSKGPSYLEIPEKKVVTEKCKCNLCEKEFDLQVSLLSHYMFAHAPAGRKPLRILN